MMHTKDVFYQWRKPVKFDNEDSVRMIIPRADPYLYEQPIDYLFDSIAAAHTFLLDSDELWGDAIKEDWQVCQVTVESGYGRATEILPEEEPDV